MTYFFTSRPEYKKKTHRLLTSVREIKSLLRNLMDLIICKLQKERPQRSLFITTVTIIFNPLFGIVSIFVQEFVGVVQGVIEQLPFELSTHLTARGNTFSLNKTIRWFMVACFLFLISFSSHASWH